MNENPDTVLGKMSILLHPQTGFLIDTYRVPLFNDAPSISSFGVLMGYGAEEISKKNYSGGGSFDAKHALIKAIGEGVERLCVFRSLQPQHVRPTRKQLRIAMDYSMYGKKAPERTAPDFDWVVGHSLHTNKRVFVPAELVHIKHASGDKVSFRGNTNGTAAGPTKEFAQLRGLLEVLERDAFLVTYLAKISPMVVDLQSAPESLQILKRRVERYNLELYVLDLYTDMPLHTIAALILDRTGTSNPVIVGLGAGFDLSSTIVGAIEEAANALSSYRTHFSTESKKIGNRLRVNPALIRTIDDRARYWNDICMLEHARFLTEGARVPYRVLDARYKSTRQTSGGDLTGLLQHLRTMGKEVVSVDLAPSALTKKGFFVEKVFLPDLQQLYFDESDRVINENRIREVLQRHRISVPVVYNQIPHPFL